MASVAYVVMWVYIDVDECAGPDRGGCSHECVNIQGSYECLCPPGYRVASNQLTCQGQSLQQYISSSLRSLLLAVATAVFSSIRLFFSALRAFFARRGILITIINEFINCRELKCSSDIAKQLFYQAANAIFG